MPKTVAVLEGDSSSLVKSINDAKGAMTGMEKEARKLSDQIRDVADEADKAAGTLVQKIGGPTAVKAIAGVGAAFAGAQVALGAFAGSMSAFAATQGEAGAKAMADIDMALNKLQGQLFTAVMGTDNMEEATQTLISVINFLTDAVHLALTPIEGLAKLIRYLTDSNRDAKDAAEQNAKEQKKAAEMLLTLEDNYKTTTKAISANEEKVRSLTGSTEDLRKTQLRQALSATDALAEQLKADERLREAQEIGIEVAKKKADNLREVERSLTFDQTLVPGTEEYSRRFAELYAGLTQATINAARATREGWSAETLAGLQALGAQRQALAKELLGVSEEVKKPTSETNTVNVRTVNEDDTGADGEEHEDPYVARQRSMDNFMEKERVAEEERIANLAKANKERIAMFGSANDEQIQLYYEAQIEKNVADQAEFEAARQRAIDLHDLTFDLTQSAAEFVSKKRAEEAATAKAELDANTAALQEYGKMGGQMIADGEKASKIAEKMARKALGGQISALGDKAMAEAAIMAAALNPMAIPMGAAGLAAYAAAAALGADTKKAASSTPAAPTTPTQVNQSVSYNLQVDAAFANGESIARQFAMAQREATRRGMVPAGVF